MKNDVANKKQVSPTRHARKIPRMARKGRGSLRQVMTLSAGGHLLILLVCSSCSLKRLRKRAASGILAFTKSKKIEVCEICVLGLPMQHPSQTEKSMEPVGVFVFRLPFAQSMNELRSEAH